MKKEIADKWVAALRSGKYVQATGRLALFHPASDTHHFCCLGVLENCIFGHPINKFAYVLNNKILSEAQIADAMGTPENGLGVAIGPRRYTNLAEANDEGENFTAIADWIEQNYQNL